MRNVPGFALGSLADNCWEVVADVEAKKRRCCEERDYVVAKKMVKRLNDLNNLPDKDKEYILYALDGLIKSAKLQTL